MDFTALPETLEGFLDSIIPALSQVVVLLLFLSFIIGSDRLQARVRRTFERLKAFDEYANAPFIKESALTCHLLPDQSG